MNRLFDYHTDHEPITVRDNFTYHELFARLLHASLTDYRTVHIVLRMMNRLLDYCTCDKPSSRLLYV